MEYFKTAGREGGSSEPPEPPLDPPLNCLLLMWLLFIVSKTLIGLCGTNVSGDTAHESLTPYKASGTCRLNPRSSTAARVESGPTGLTCIW